MVVGDRGYWNDKVLEKGNNGKIVNDYITEVLSHHETVNSRLKDFDVLSGTFRYGLDLHIDCFHAVASLAQLMIENGHLLFSM